MTANLPSAEDALQHISYTILSASEKTSLKELQRRQTAGAKAAEQTNSPQPALASVRLPTLCPHMCA